MVSEFGMKAKLTADHDVKFHFIFHKYFHVYETFQLFYNRDRIPEIKYISNIICKNIYIHIYEMYNFFLDNRYQIVN